VGGVLRGNGAHFGALAGVWAKIRSKPAEKGENKPNEGGVATLRPGADFGNVRADLDPPCRSGRAGGLCHA